MARKKAGRGARKAKEPFPEDALRDLEQRLGRGLPQAVLLRGPERYFRERGIELVVKAAQAAGMELCRHDAIDPEYSSSRLVDDLTSGALFGGARCVVLRAAERVVVDRASAFSSSARDALRARLASEDEGIVVLSAEKLNDSHPLVKAAVAAEAPVVGCRRLYESPPHWDPDPRKAELVQWCAARARALGVEVSVNEAAYVCMATGNDLAAIEDQLQRLVGRGKEAIQELITWDASASVWDVADHMVGGDVQRSLAGLETLFAGGASQRDGTRTIDREGIVAQLSSAISGKLREAARAADGIARGLDPKRAIAAADLKGPPQAMKALEARLGMRPPGAWGQMLVDLGQVERRSRSSVPVDATEFARLALRWRRRKAAAR